MKDGGRINLREGGVLGKYFHDIQLQIFIRIFWTTFTAGSNAVFPRLNQLEQGVNRAEQDLGRIRDRLGDQRQLMVLQVRPGIWYTTTNKYEPLNWSYTLYNKLLIEMQIKWRLTRWYERRWYDGFRW